MVQHMRRCTACLTGRCSLTKQGHLVLTQTISVPCTKRSQDGILRSFAHIYRKPVGTDAASHKSFSNALPELTLNTLEWYLVQGQAPLHAAAIFAGRDVTELLLARGADINAKDYKVSQHWGLLPLTALTA